MFLILSCLAASQQWLLLSGWISFHLGWIPAVGLSCSCTIVLAQEAGMWEKRKGHDGSVLKKMPIWSGFR